MIKISNIHQVFIVSILFFLIIPQGYIWGVKENTTISGSEYITDLPSLQTKSFKHRDFQKNFEEWWQSHYLYRRKMLKLKNQIYDILNFGRIHSGYNNNVIEGKNKYLFEKNYFLSFQHICRDLPPQMQKIQELKKETDKRNIPMYFVLAANKAVIYRSNIPYQYEYFYDTNCNYYKQIEQQLKEWQIPVFNSYDILVETARNDKYQPYSKTGTHWNLYGAGKVWQESFSTFGWGNINLKAVEMSQQPYYTERDIADLLNLMKKYKTEESYYRPILQAEKVLSGTTAVIGNSFSREYVMSINSSGGAERLLHYENAPLNMNNAADIFKAQRLIFVYTDNAFLDSEHQFYKKLDVLLKALNGPYEYRFSENLDNYIKIKGLSFPEKWGRWSDGDNIEMTMKVSEAKNQKIVFDIRPFFYQKHNRQKVFVAINGKQVAEWLFSAEKDKPQTELRIQPEDIKDGKVQISFQIDNPKSPQELNMSNDGRKLGIGFVSAIVQKAEE